MPALRVGELSYMRERGGIQLDWNAGALACKTRQRLHSHAGGTGVAGRGACVPVRRH
jgi:hypothetical protein